VASLLTLAGAATLALAQLPSDSPSGLIGIRSLALSPDGSQIAFTYQGDVWVAAADGGRATPITSNVEYDDNPVWSPDGKWIAFSSNRTGNNDIFVVSANGGQPKRLTYNTGSDIPSDWTADGKEILFRGNRDRSENGVFAIDVATGKFRPIFYDNLSVGSPKASPDGKKVLYTRLGFPWVRARYTGSAASQLWEYDIATGQRREVRNNEMQHLWPNYTASGDIVTVTATEKTPSSSPLNKPIGRVNYTERGTPNVYAVSGPRSATPLTRYTGDAVRFLSAARKANRWAFERDGSIYVVTGNDAPKKVEFTASVDEKQSTEERLILTTGVDNFDRSPDGKTVIFQVRGEVWTVPVEKGKGPNKDDATRLTFWEGTDEQPIFTPDGKAAFFVSDRDGARRLYRMDLESKEAKAVTSVDADVTNLQLTPDKKSLSFWQLGNEGGLYTVPVDGGSAKRVFKRTGNGPIDYKWSPDGRWIAYAEVLEGSGYYYWESARNIYVVDAATGESRDVTQLSAQHYNPSWSADGKYLYFGSNRQGDGLFILPLQKEDLRPNEVMLEFKKPDPKTPVKVEIDFDGIETRVRRLVGQQLQGNIVSDAENGAIYFQSEGDIWRADYDGENARRLTNGGGIRSFDMASDGKNLVFIRTGQMNVLDLRRQGNPTTTVAFRADWTRNVANERRAAFQQFWREFNRGFYDANFHGRDWVALRNKYEKFLPGVGHRQDFATVLNMMVGELEASHAEVGAGPGGGGPGTPSSAHLGFVVDYSWGGEGIKVKEVPANTPAAFAKTKLEPGDVVMKINGKPVSTDEALYREVLNGETGREITLSVRGRTAEMREVKYRAISGGEFGGIVFNNLLQQRRKYVEEKSGGKLTYVHIAGMGQGELNRFQQQVWQYARGKQGLIIDVRNNGGGNTSDRILDILERKPNAFYQIRDESPISGPGQTLNMPMVVMCAESSFSNAEMFPSSMKSLGLAKVVGKPTPGYVIYTYGLPLIDGTSARMPSTGVFRADGTNMENNGLVPDFVVDLTPDDYFAGRDPQLDKAIEVLVRR